LAVAAILIVAALAEHGVGTQTRSTLDAAHGWKSCPD
jgi:hypothetical protein